MKKLIMCDLDNTLLPLITQEKFVEIWFRDVARKFLEHGLDPSKALHAMNDGCRAMLLNNGDKLNIDVFYDIVCEHSGYKRSVIEPVLDDYYSSTFVNVRQIARENPHAVTIARLMRQKAEHAVIATMPLFPIEACDMRMSWVGLRADMFDLVTTCDYSRYSKPSTEYFAQIMESFGAKPEETLMIGNDVREDMQPCEKLGIETFLVTDYMLTHDLDYDRFRRGSYEDLTGFLNSI